MKKTSRIVAIFTAAIMSCAVVAPVNSYAAKTTNKTSTSSSTKTGFSKKGDSYYYYKNGELVKSAFVKVNNKYYYFMNSGKMATTWLKIGDFYYKFGTDGIMLTGWQQINNKNYYFGNDGKMVTSWKKIDGSYYKFGTDGIMVTGWKKIDNKWYYFGTDGKMRTGSVIIDRVQYRFDSAGVWDGKNGVQINDFRKSNWGETRSTTSKKDNIHDLGKGLYYGNQIKVGDYNYRTYYSFDANNRLYKGELSLDRDASNVFDEFSVYLAYNQLIEAYTNKYGTPKYSGIISYNDYMTNYLSTWEAVELGYASGIAVWETSTSKITIHYIESDVVKPHLFVDYESLSYSPSLQKEAINTDGI